MSTQKSFSPQPRLSFSLSDSVIMNFLKRATPVLGSNQGCFLVGKRLLDAEFADPMQPVSRFSVYGVSHKRLRFSNLRLIEATIALPMNTSTSFLFLGYDIAGHIVLDREVAMSDSRWHFLFKSIADSVYELEYANQIIDRIDAPMSSYHNIFFQSHGEALHGVFSGQSVVATEYLFHESNPIIGEAHPQPPEYMNYFVYEVGEPQKSRISVIRAIPINGDIV